MGDWRTLHLFDHAKFSREIVPGLQKRHYLEHRFDVAIGQYWLRGEDKERRLPALLEVSRQFTENGFADPVESDVYEDFGCIATLTMFSECALFNPHFILGKSLLHRSMHFTTWGTVAEALIENIRIESMLGCYGFGIQGWLSPEELELLLLDWDEVLPSEPDYADYVNELKIFLQTARDHGMGVVAGVNMNEASLAQLASPLPGEDLFKGLALKYLNTYPK